MASEVRHHSKYPSREQDKMKGSKIVTFYKNGDLYFGGYVVTITPRRFRTFEVLLSELSRITNLPQGVRYLLDHESGIQIVAIEQLQDGKSYVCASNSRLKKLDYGKKAGHLPQWGSRNKIELPALLNPPQVIGIQTPRQVKPVRRSIETKERRSDQGPRHSFKARNVTVIRNGHRPRLAVRVLLSKRTAQTVNQFLDLVNDSLGVTGSSNVRKLYTSKGKQVYEVSDLFNDEDGIFIAVGNERFRVDNIESILSDDSKNTNKKPIRSNRVSNDGMDKHDSYRKESDKKSRDESLPTILDNISHNNNNNYKVKYKGSDNHDDNRAPKSPSPKPRKPVSKHLVKDGKTIDKKNEEPSNNVKLPQIAGTGHNLVSTTHEKQENRTRKTSKSKKDSNTRISSPRGVGEEGNKLAESHESQKSDDTEKPKNRTSWNSTGLAHEQEIEYSRVTDRKVEDVYDMGRKIGDGNFAVVRQCTSKSTKKEFALKIIDKRKISGKEKMIEDEITIMRRCRHPNIVRLYEDYDTPTEMFLVMEFVKGGDLFDAISATIKFPENVAKDYFRDMCKALQYLHKQNVVHRDLKPENLLVHKRPNGQKKLKLADFGLAVEVKLPLFTVCGTPTYVAPEILEEEGYGLKIDTWAAGVITYIMLCGFPPFRSAKRDQDELFDLIQAGDFEFLPPYWDNISYDAKDLISQLLAVDPKKRYSAEKALNHKWVKLKSPTPADLSRALLDGTEVSNAKRRFKAAALAVQGTKKFENLADEFRQHRGERFISI